MQKSKISRSGDRLGELPDSLIFEIFWFLPITDVVRTTILSKRWKGLWKTAPFLNLDDSTIENFGDYTTKEVADRARALVNGALLFWKGVKIMKFKIDFHYQFKQPLVHEAVNDVDKWVLLAKENEVEEVYLHMRPGEGYTVPWCLYSCSSLKVLSFRACDLRITNRSVKWDQLKSLTIDGHGVVSEDLVNLILSGSPNLEVFSLTLVDSQESLCIRSSSLRKLSIHKYLRGDGYCVGDPSINTELKIWTPNLERLEMSKVAYSKCLLMDVSSLRDVGFQYFDPKSKEWDYLLEETLVQILPTIWLVEKVTLSCWCIKVLVIMKRKHVLSPLCNVKFLKLAFSKQEQIADLLELFPNVKRLVLQDAGKYNQTCRDSLEFEFEADLPNLFLLQLRTVEVTWVEGNNSIFPLIQILLKYASNLEKMVFQVDGSRPSRRSDSLFLASQNVLKMPRSSSAAELIFCENTS